MNTHKRWLLVSLAVWLGAATLCAAITIVRAASAQSYEGILEIVQGDQRQGSPVERVFLRLDDGTRLKLTPGPSVGAATLRASYAQRVHLTLLARGETWEVQTIQRAADSPPPHR